MKCKRCGKEKHITKFPLTCGKGKHFKTCKTCFSDIMKKRHADSKPLPTPKQIIGAKSIAVLVCPHCSNYIRMEEVVS